MVKASTTTESPKLVTASARDLHLAPRKIRLVTNVIKGMNANDAMVQLQHLNKKGAPMVAKLLRSAMADAKNNFSLDVDHLFIKSITADMGKVLKRYFPRARGSAFVIRRKLSHVNLVLELRKTGIKSKSKFALFKKDEQPPFAKASGDLRPAVMSVDQKEATNIKETSDTPKKRELFRSSEQIKENRMQNKRRLFNRKSGE